MRPTPTARSVTLRAVVTVTLPPDHTETLGELSCFGGSYQYRPTAVTVTYESTHAGQPWRLADRIDVLGTPVVDGRDVRLPDGTAVDPRTFSVYASELPSTPDWFRDIVASAEPTTKPLVPQLRGDAVSAATRAAIDADLRGCMEDGYDSDKVNSVLGAISDASGLMIVCVWDFYDEYGPGGNSDFYVDPEDGGPLRELVGDLWRWLNSDPDDPDSPDSPGDPGTWTGSATSLHPDNLAWNDGRHNFAEDRND